MMKRASLLVTNFMLFVILVITDQLTKHLAVVRLKNQAAYNLINGILELILQSEYPACDDCGRSGWKHDRPGTV